jgi:hypothetical protein
MNPMMVRIRHSGSPSFMYAVDFAGMKDALMRGTMSSKMGTNDWTPPAISGAPMKMVMVPVGAPAQQGMEGKKGKMSK